ncbi:hypothetical protein [Sporolactobacillus pectinivorans]|uniref:hypothetical protein n=1 Tax=Sporolactobacillus pectinivorans TaxID=1591408 RepID=UPI000C26304D|nr:hypothetical protein [Sporolactobacillus pectinivorans]
MKQLICHKPIRFLYTLLMLIAVFTVGTQADFEKIAVAEGTSQRLSGESHHFSPVMHSEKMLAEQINSQRKKNHTDPLSLDWDLFRFSRFEARDLASGKISKIDATKIERVLAECGRTRMSIHTIVVHGVPGRQFPGSSWWRTDDVRLLIGSQSIHYLGTGHARGLSGEYWVILYASRT